ncbi:MAG: hypothetical protein H7232_15930, partial [Aeromicrobium sp.]|nr:hypothetical protein [Burkholderiales bacterium]
APQPSQQPPQAEVPAPPAEWGQVFASGNAQLALEERGATVVSGKRAMSYGFVASGYPTDKIYFTWLRMLSGQTILLDTLRADASGVLVTERGAPLAKQTFNLYGLYRGEAVDVALVSQDQSVRAFSRVVPFPLEARDKGCTLVIEMATAGGRQFAVRGDGFQPKEEIVTTFRIDDQAKTQKQPASSTGSFVDVVDTTQATRAGGTASYQAAGKRCKVSLSHEWGSASKKQ